MTTRGLALRRIASELGVPKSTLQRALAREAVSRARAAFKRRYGMPPEAWLEQWRTGELPDTFENNYALTDALTLAHTPRGKVKRTGQRVPIVR